MRSGAIIFLLTMVGALTPALGEPFGIACPDYTAGNTSWNEPTAYKTDSGASQGVLSVKARALLALRKDVLAQRETDGGTLSDEHRAIFQAKLDAIRQGHY